MNIDNLNPENNNQNNLNSGINPPEPNIAPVEPNFGTPPGPMNGPLQEQTNAAPMPTLDQANIPPAPMSASEQTNIPPTPMATSGIPAASPAPMATPEQVNGISASTTPSPINLAPEGVVDTTPIVDPLSPLVSAPLTSNTPLMGTEQVAVSSSVNQNINPANNTINELPSNPATFGGVPTPPGNPVIDNNALPNMPVKKKGGKKVLIIVLIFILILGIGGGVYYFLNIANAQPSISVVPNITEWELGTELSKNVNDYAAINGVDASSCTLNTEAINISNTGTYSYSINCPGLKNPVNATLEVRDTKGPEIELKEITVKPDTSVSVWDFVEKCEDPSIDDECDIAINDDKIDLDELVKTEGTYSIPLIAKDNYNHETIVKATLKVDSSAPSEYLNCELLLPYETELNATITENYEYGINDLSEIATVNRVITYEFENQEDYEKVKEEYETNQTVDLLTGKATFDDKKFVVKLRINIDVEDLQNELDSETELKTYEDIAIFHDEAGDICSLS